MQVSFSIWFQELFSSFRAFFDVFFGICTFFGEELFLLVLFLIFYYAINKRIAKIFGVASIVSVGLNSALKELCKIERPIEDPNVRYVVIDNFFVNTKKLEGTYSFPSGHAMLTTALFTSIGLNLKNKRFWILSVFIIALVAMSRIYLGVHFLIDCVVGIVLGVIIGYLIHLLYKKINNKEYFIYLALILFASLLFIFAANADDFKVIGAIYAFSIGSILEMRFVDFNPSEGSIVKKIIRLAIGVVLAIALKEGLKYLFNLIGEYNILHLIRYFIVGMVAIFGYPLIFKKVKL